MSNGPHNRYRERPSYEKAVVIYEMTFRFCGLFLHKRDATIGQMMEAARSGKQSIVEASKAAKSSKDQELKQLRQARESFETLSAVYQNYLQARGLPLWAKGSKEVLFVQTLSRRNDESYETYRGFIETSPVDVAANIAICLAHQTSELLTHQITKRVQSNVPERVAS